MLFVLLSGTTVFAHPRTQKGILAETTIDPEYSSYYVGSFVGGDAVGWRIMEERHTNGTEQTYSFDTSDPYLTNTLKQYVRAGADMWSDVIDIEEKTDGSGMGLIYIEHYETSPANAKFVADIGTCTDGRTGHLTRWTIKIYEDSISVVNATTFAHEFGHMIGLTDLYENASANKLMYGYSNRTVSAPTNLDKWGARVITGEHTTHTWGYKCHSAATTGGNRHIKYCIMCKGLTNTILNCSYNSQNICTLCGVAYNVNPASIGIEAEIS
jgi:hypothetical protein